MSMLKSNVGFHLQYRTIRGETEKIAADETQMKKCMILFFVPCVCDNNNLFEVFTGLREFLFRFLFSFTPFQHKVEAGG